MHTQPPPPSPEMTCGFLIQLVFCKNKKTVWFIGVEVEQEMSVPPPKKNPGFASGEASKVFLSQLSNKWGGAFGTQGEQELTFSLDLDDFEAVFGRGFERAIEQF